MQMVNWKLKKWSWRKHSSCFPCSEAEIRLTSLKADFQHCFIWYRGSQKLESLHISWEKRSFQLWVKGGPCFPPKGLGPSARRGEMLQQDHGKEQRFPQVGKVQILWLFFCKKKMFQLAYVLFQLSLQPLSCWAGRWWFGIWSTFVCLNEVRVCLLGGKCVTGVARCDAAAVDWKEPAVACCWNYGNLQ